LMTKTSRVEQSFFISVSAQRLPAGVAMPKPVVVLAALLPVTSARRCYLPLE
jgi:hypothetical protein